MSDDERTLIEENMVLKAPLPFELEAVGKVMVDLIQKAPAELRPAALAAAIAVIQGIQLTADASVEALPDYPISLSTEAIKAQAQYLNDLYKNLPPDAPAYALLPAMSLLQTVDGMVDPLRGSLSMSRPNVLKSHSDDIAYTKLGNHAAYRS